MLRDKINRVNQTSTACNIKEKINMEMKLKACGNKDWTPKWRICHSSKYTEIVKRLKKTQIVCVKRNTKQTKTNNNYYSQFDGYTNTIAYNFSI